MLGEIINKYAAHDTSIYKLKASEAHNKNIADTTSLVVVTLDSVMDLPSFINENPNKTFIIEMPKKYDFDKFVKEVKADEIDVYRDHHSKSKTYYTVVKA